jgi:hypothetical protein
MAQKTVQDYIREYITPALVAVFGWYLSATITEVRSDVKSLLESKATHTEQLRTIENRLERLEKDRFGISSILISLYKVAHFVYDKPKQLQYRDGEFYYT